MQGGNISPVPKNDLRQVVAQNLRYFMGLESCPYATANALAVAAKVAPNTVRNYLDPTKRTVTTGKPDGYPTLDKLKALADALGREPWELLHPDIQRSLSEREMYKTIESDFQLRARHADLAKTQELPVLHSSKRHLAKVKQ